jgi:hypothetical protein
MVTKANMKKEDEGRTLLRQGYSAASRLLCVVLRQARLRSRLWSGKPPLWRRIAAARIPNSILVILSKTAVRSSPGRLGSLQTA